MGAPKQKWTAEEEAALKAGVRKHGMGKWRTILTDPEFHSVLRLRSNVDLKDKWRNINVTAIWGSRQKAKLALKRDENSKALVVAQRNDIELSEAIPLSIAAGPSSNGGSKESPPKVDSMIMEAIEALKEPSGSDRASIALYIESKYSEMQNMRKVLGGKLNKLVSSGRLFKAKQKYKVAGDEEKVKEGAKVDKTAKKTLTKAQVDQELSKLRGLTASEIAAAAAKAVAEAEAAIAEAEQAAREAEMAEAEAEAAQVFAKAAVKAFKYRMRYT